MLEEIVQRVTATTGISEDNARAAVTEVLNFLREKLPQPLGGYLEQFLEGGSPEEGTLDKVLGALGGIFGSKKEDS
jgi:hypothetical protein